MRISELLSCPVKHIMMDNLITVYPNDIISKIDVMLQEKGIHHLPVVDEEGMLKGLITTNDIMLVKNVDSKVRKRDDSYITKLMNSYLAKDIMTKDLITVSSTATLGQCLDIFKRNIFHALPVVKEGKLVGLITTYDLLLLAYNEEKQEQIKAIITA